jgi:hypothetical protein
VWNGGTGMGSANVLRRVCRAAYWVGMVAVPFLCTAAIVVAAFATMQMVGVGFGVGPPIVIAAGVGSWAGLIRLYRAFVPLPCRECGRSARASSLNPITVRCGWCGHVEVLQARVLGAP